MRDKLPGFLAIVLCALCSARTALSEGHEFLRPSPTWCEVDGKIYGAQPDERGPIGGGPGYRDIVTSGTVRVSTADALAAALKNARTGDVVYVEGDAEIDFTDLIFAEDFVLEIPEGVTLASNRGHNGSPGALLYSRSFKTSPLIAAAGPKVRVTGLRLQGPDPETRVDHHRRAFNTLRGDGTAQKEYYYRLPLANGIRTKFSELTVDNCELWGWSHSAISLGEGEGHRIHHNHIHHNQRRGLGYGVTVNRGVALVERNLFAQNRHSIAGTGRAPGGYEARHNVEWRSEPYIKHAFDMHADPNGSGQAGLDILIHHNTFMNPQVRAVAIRGKPRSGARVTRNWFFHEQPDSALIQPWPTGGDSGVVLEDNAYGVAPALVLDRPLQSFSEAWERSALVEKAGRTAAALTLLSQAMEMARTGPEKSQILIRMAALEEGRERYAAARLHYASALAVPQAAPDDLALARRQLDSERLKAWHFERPVTDWQEVFQDDFDREMLGEHWEVVSGDWIVERGRLVCRGEGGTGIIYLARRFPWPQRVECRMRSDATAPCDLSPILQSDPAPVNPFYQTVIPGYLVQFGANRNKANQLRRNMSRIWASRCKVARNDILIAPGRTHDLVAEFDGKAVRLIVDGTVVLEYEEKLPLMGTGHDMTGFYIMGGGAIEHLRVYQPRHKTDGAIAP